MNLPLLAPMYVAIFCTVIPGVLVPIDYGIKMAMRTGTDDFLSLRVLSPGFSVVSSLSCLAQQLMNYPVA